MDLVPVLLSRIRFAYVISVRIIFPAFTIELAAWLATLEGTRLATGNPVYRRVLDFWLNVFALSFRMGVVTEIVMAFQFGANRTVGTDQIDPGAAAWPRRLHRVHGFRSAERRQGR